LTVTDNSIEREVMIEAPIEVVWRTITEPEQISRWFTDDVQLDARPGGRGVLVFVNDDATQTVELFVEAVEPPTRFAFRWAHPNGERPVAGNSMLVEFILASEGDEQTRLRVVETGLELLSWTDADKAAYAEDHRGGWRRGTDRLAQLFTGTAHE
jgi:uncharacterized protein YndB with AHSA1/START domain